MAVKKLEFMPESGTVDTYDITSTEHNSGATTHNYTHIKGASEQPLAVLKMCSKDFLCIASMISPR